MGVFYSLLPIVLALVGGFLAGKIIPPRFCKRLIGWILPLRNLSKPSNL